MSTAYATHEDYTKDAPRHLQKIAKMIENAAISDEAALHPSQKVAIPAHLQLKLSQDTLPKSAEDYKKWKEVFQWELGLALGHYQLVADISAGDGSEAAYNRRKAILASATDEGARDEARLQAEYEELKDSKTVLVGIVTKKTDDIYKESLSGRTYYISEEGSNAEAQEAKTRLQIFYDDLNTAREASTPSDLSPRGPAVIAENQRLKNTLKESLVHFDKASIGTIPSETGEVAVHGAIELKVHLQETMLEKFISSHLRMNRRATKEGAIHNMESEANGRIKYLIGKDLDNYGLVPVSGKFDKETKTFTFHVLDKERYGEILKGDGQIDPNKAFGENKNERPALEAKTREGLEKYIAAFHRAQDLGLDKAATKQR